MELYFNICFILVAYSEDVLIVNFLCTGVERRPGVYDQPHLFVSFSLITTNFDLLKMNLVADYFWSRQPTPNGAFNFHNGNRWQAFKCVKKKQKHLEMAATDGDRYLQ